MQVEVSCVLSLPDELIGVNELESQIQSWGRQLMAEALRRSWQLYQAQHSECSKCGSSETVSYGSKAYHLRTCFGTVELARDRRRCRVCGYVFQPLDKALAAAGPGRATSNLREAVVLAAASWPFEIAAQTLRKLCGAELSGEWVRQVSESSGQVEAAEAEREAKAIAEGKSAVTPTSGADKILVVMDGGFVPSRENPNGMEGKVGVIATGRDKIGKQRYRLTARRYVASFQPAETFGPLVYRAAAGLGVEQAQQVVVLGDGAEWIKTLAEWYFPQGEFRLDLWHLLRRCSAAVGAEKLTEEQQKATLDELVKLLRRGEAQAAEGVVRTHLHSKVGEEFAAYLTNQRRWIVDSEQLKAKGEVVGSGAIEKGVDLVINRRLKGRRGMRWRRDNANGIVSLRTIILNEAA